MSRPRSITDEQILDAARAEFLEQGVSATTADIARRAGISEGTIFRRFATKDELLVTALAPTGAPPFCSIIAECATHPDPRKDLVRIARDVLAFFAELLPRMHLLMSCHVHPAELMARHDEPPPLIAIQHLADYFRAADEAGLLRVPEPTIAARTLLGAMHQYAFLTHGGIQPPDDDGPEAFARLTVDLLLDGLLPADTVAGVA